MSADWKATDLFYRQVNPNHWDGKQPNSVAFLPMPKDKDQLSVDDAQLVTAEDAWKHFTQSLGFQSIGTWAVSSGEITAAGDLTLKRDPVTDEPEISKHNSAHCVIDFAKLDTKGKKKRCAQQLALQASARGCQFKPAA